jgi:hypothetical protein
MFIGCGEVIALEQKDWLSQGEKDSLSMAAWNVFRIMESVL